MNIDIDFVIPWVDSTDSKWIEKYRSCFPNVKIDENRYRDMGLLRYWFRSIEEHAPWVNKIFFITFGHVPEFLDLEHPKIVVVNHEDYIPHQFLPTFSSHVIELNLHRIEGLSEHFVYFNDDTFLVNDVSPSFFFKNGTPRHQVILRPIVGSYYNHISSVQHNNHSIINENFEFRKSFKHNKYKWFHMSYGIYNLTNILFSFFNNFIGINEDHMPTPMLKSTIQVLWRSSPQVLEQTSYNKVRDVKKDVNQWLIKLWQIMEGEFYPQKLGISKLVELRNKSSIDEVEKVLFQNRIKMLCINDHVENWEEYEELLGKVKDLFKNKYPVKSTFEK